MKTTLIKTACVIFTAVLATAMLGACEQKSDDLIRAQKDGQKKASENLAAHEKRTQQ